MRTPAHKRTTSRAQQTILSSAVSLAVLLTLGMAFTNPALGQKHLPVANPRVSAIASQGHAHPRVVSSPASSPVSASVVTEPAPPTTTTPTATSTTVPALAPTTPPVAPSLPVGASDAYAAWTRVADCEEGGWVGSSGAAYPDSLGIDATNWYAYGGGTDTSPLAQIAVAQALEAASGTPGFVPDQNGCAAW